MPTLGGFLYDSSGTAISAATINVYARNTVTPVVATTTTNASGYWQSAAIAEGRYDVEIVNGTTTLRLKYDDEIQIERGEFKTLQVRGSDNAFAYTLAGGAIAAARTLNLPVITATDTLAALALAQTFTAAKTFNDQMLLIRNPADTFSYTIVAGAITAARSLTLPVITGTDTLVVTTLAQTLASKTLTSPVITTSPTAAGATWTDLGIVTTVDINGGTLAGVTVDGGLTWSAAQNFGANIVYINDTANANMTVGLTINQGAADNHALALKSSDVGHPITDNAEADTYGAFQKVEATSGGLQIIGLKDADGTNGYAILLEGILGETADTTKTTAAAGVVTIQSFVGNGGTGQTTVGADGNVLVVRNGGSTARFIFDAEGSGHADVEWVAFDSYDDLALIHDVEQHLLDRESAAGTYNRHALEAAGIIGRDSWHFENGRPRAMVNFTRLAMAHNGTLIQIGRRFKERDAEIAALRTEIEALRRALPAA